jgi:hypothetical protein
MAPAIPAATTRYAQDTHQPFHHQIFPLGFMIFIKDS